MRGAIGVLLLAAGCAPAPETPPPTLALERCHVRGVDAETRCGVLSVPEDPARPEGRQIPLRVVVLPAVSPTPDPDPLFLLAGGPGQASSEIIHAVHGSLSRILARRDLVFVDQRGTGASNPLDCPEDEQDPLTRLGEPTDPEELRACRAQLEERADLGFYGTSLAADDLDRVAEALGYERVNVFGGSYGTRLALEWARRHPERVRTLILDGVAPPDEAILAGSVGDARAAFEALAEDCAADPGCQHLDPRADLLALLTELHEAPRSLTLDHPRTGESLTIELDAVHLAGMVRGILYAPTLARVLPLALRQAREGDLAPLLAQFSVVGTGAAEAMSLGLTMTVVCAEDHPRIPVAEEGGAPSLDLIGRSGQLGFDELCAEWPRAAVDPSFYEPVALSIPTLILSGGLDPVTPPRLGERARQSLDNAVHGVAPEVGHGVITMPCAPRLMRKLLEAGSVAGLDVSCLEDIQRPAFFSTTMGPAASEVPDAAR